MKNFNQLSFFSKGFIFLCILTLLACQDNMLEEIQQQTDSEKAPQTEKRTIARTAFETDLVKRWAPVHYMDVDATGTYAEGGKSDYITAINYDGDWNASNNWENVSAYSLSAHCYYSVVETHTHWFIIYSFFHPRDWTDIFLLYNLDQHENDLEGVLMVIQKDGSSYGTLQGAVTVSHSDFFSYTPSGSPFTSGQEDIDGTLQMTYYNGVPHPVTAQEAKGHGLKAWPQNNIDGDGVIYYPSMSDVAQIPADNYDSYVEYKLVDIFESGGLWDQRFNSNLFYNSGGGFKGNNFKDGGANAPWAWNDGNDGIIQNGEMATDPAKLVDTYFDGVGNFSHLYLNNRYNNQAGGVVTLYQHCDYKGYAVSLHEGDYSLSQLQSLGVSNDDISSLKVDNGYKVTLYEHSSFGGRTITKSGSDNCLSSEGFNDELSSISVVRN
ncbi:hypothetical protein JMN32_03195 [Fulvivirga sp. 29W222]|uniref:Beta/gamma crystallin 'Greek key' domain-containing protein n=1 Tax=Fulvivirga marina TaxID=2494733 RepID=A0A937FVM0_9BACT|nr:hypothetical protein [Fulvivirga marina]MBL6445298.1 hypothetical protein [Fulvivirga marina]